MIISRLRRIKILLKATRNQLKKEEAKHYENDSDEMKIILDTQNITLNPKYTESGFGSEASQNDLDDVTNMENLYASADSVSLKKRVLNEIRIDGTDNLHFSKAINSLDETLRLLKDTANQL